MCSTSLYAVSNTSTALFKIMYLVCCCFFKEKACAVTGATGAVVAVAAGLITPLLDESVYTLGGSDMLPCYSDGGGAALRQEQLIVYGGLV